MQNIMMSGKPYYQGIEKSPQEALLYKREKGERRPDPVQRRKPLGKIPEILRLTIGGTDLTPIRAPL